MDVKKVLQEAESLSKELDNRLKALAEALSSVLATGAAVQMLPQTAQQRNIELQFHDVFTTFKRRIENGVLHIINATVELSKTDKNFVKSELAADLKKFVDFVYNLRKDQEPIDGYVKDLLEKNKTLQQVCGISDHTLDMFYKAAKYIFEQHQFEQAADAFGFLTIVNSKKASFWLGLGNAEYQCARFEPALLALTFAKALDPSNPIPYIQAARCYEKINQIDFAMHSLQVALDLMGNRTEHSGLRKIVQQHKNALEQRR
jgi:type III secretion system low calcium response chaperone LcrH/SycD